MTDIKTYIGPKGYVVVKKFFTKEVLEDARRQLTVTPYINTNFGAKAESFPVYMENKNKLYLPKFYGITNFGPPCNCTIPDGIDIDIEFNGSLREKQIVPIEKCLKALKQDGGGLLAVACGYGKTAMGLYLSSQLKKKTLVVINKESLLEQWVDRIKQFVPNASIGIIQGKRFEVEGSDIVIGMLQSLSMKDFPQDAFHSFGFVIYDECHLVPCKVFSKILKIANFKYHLGLSATPQRTDGMTKTLKWFIGEIIFKDDKTYITDQVIVHNLVIKSDNNVYCEELLNYLGNPNMSAMVSNITQYLPRTKLIIRKLLDIMNEKRKVIILSNRRDHLVDMKTLIEQDGRYTSGYYVGQMKKKLLNESEQCDIILGTYSMASTGMDIAGLNTLVLASPVSNVIQSVGRIMRKSEVITNRIIIDVIDEFSVFANQGIKRGAYYSKKKYMFKYFEASDDSDEIIEIKDTSKKIKKIKIIPDDKPSLDCLFK
jgi:superfamily II DNA or RNA helicase